MATISVIGLPRTHRLAAAAASITMLLGGGLAAAEDPAAPTSPVQAPAAGCVRGTDLMSPAERAQHQAQMRGLSAEDHAKFMAAHHAAMQGRAAERGLTLCSEMSGPGMMGGGMGKGPQGPGGAVPPASSSPDPKATP